MTTTTDAVTPDVQQAQTADRSGLEGFLRDLYGIAAYFTAHPEVPLPHYLTVSIRATDRAQLLQLAELFGKEPYGGDGSQTDTDLPSARGRTIALVANDRASKQASK